MAERRRDPFFTRRPLDYLAADPVAIAAVQDPSGANGFHLIRVEGSRVEKRFYETEFWANRVQWGNKSDDRKDAEDLIYMYFSQSGYMVDIYRVFKKDDGKLLDPQLVSRFEHDFDSAEGPKIIIEPAQRFGQSVSLALSNVSYLVSESASWLTVLPNPSIYYLYGDYGGVPTPAGYYDLRPACQNLNSSGGIDYPPPPKKQSEIIPGSSDVGCFRFVSNLYHDPGDPLSPKYYLYSYTYGVNSADMPDGAPLQYGSTWESIDVSSSYVYVERHDNQITWTDYFLGTRWYGDLERYYLVAGGEARSESRFLYRYNVVFKTKRKNVDPTYDSGYIYIPERVKWEAPRVSVYKGDESVYDDGFLPEGAIERIDEEEFPSYGGKLKMKDIALTRTRRGFGRSFGFAFRPSVPEFEWALYDKYYLIFFESHVTEQGAVYVPMIEFTVHGHKYFEDAKMQVICIAPHYDSDKIDVEHIFSEYTNLWSRMFDYRGRVQVVLAPAPVII